MIAGSFQTNRLINYTQSKVGSTGSTLNSSILNPTAQYSPNSSQPTQFKNGPDKKVSRAAIGASVIISNK